MLFRSVPALVVALAAALAACSPPAEPPAPAATAPTTLPASPVASAPAGAPASDPVAATATVPGPGSAPVPASAPARAPVADVRLDDTLWSVTASSAVADGTLYAFLADGTLVIGSPGGLPAAGTWKRGPGGGLTMVEASRPYAVDIVEATPHRLRLRSHNPGTPVEITLAPAGAAQPVPQRFRGEWNARLEDCGEPGTETRLRIGADRIRFHESAGTLRAVLPGGDAELAMVASLTGEGQTRLAYRKYRLAADGASLVDVSEGTAGGLVRRRCP